ncbi:LLM class flavin-dependent oxidoreductase [Streptomyces incarnatus]|uniref:LLM class flavin-dependent oxidoreductase n=1 Tax=unclassified Streptomyces TaxID=2593676 RepID=UPI0011A41EF1|nr:MULTISPECIES: LLM class flavin-dependent oxidoreductase [Streptomyces]QHC32146.1 LLM class flavin-dependent oxidoreductase [Streptomyces sp. HF10]WKE68855.1 LLM class flavin-dependent oxidoreductase [Streptomyces sp. WP-1]
MDDLKLHWCSPLDSGQQKATDKYQAGELDFDGIVDFAREADELGVDSLLMGISYHMPDPLPMIGALVRETERVKFILAYRPGLLSPTLFTQIVNTVSWMSDGRIALNLVAGISPAEQAFYGDFLAHDQRYARSEEFLDVCHRFWRGETPLTHKGEHYTIEDAQLGLGYKGGGRPHIYISGASAVAQKTAIKYADCWLRYGDTPEGIAAVTEPLLSQGCEVGIRMHVLARETRAEALAAVEDMMRDPDEQHRAWVSDFVGKSDSEAVKTSFRLADTASDDWLSPMLWSGAVAYRGGPALCVVGSYAEVAEYLYAYKAAGVSEFIFSGWPTRDEMRIFYTHVAPLIREHERNAAAGS